MRVLITGGTGFIGQQVARALLLAGHQVVGLTRDPQRAARQVADPVRWFAWDAASPPPGEALAGVDALVNLVGQSIAEGRWNPARKASLRSSRIAATRWLMQALAGLPVPPRTVVQASAVGIYGNRGGESLTEASPAGTGFLAELCRDWEAAAQTLPPTTRLVLLRIGIVLGNAGGALRSLTPVFRWGLGGPLGSGQQWMSWIHGEDLVAAIVFALEQTALRGVVNGVGPEPVTNRQFTRALGRALRRPAPWPVPGFALRAVLGEFANSLLAGQRALPTALQEAGYRFQYPDLPSALAQLCGPVAAGERILETAQWLPQSPEVVFPFFMEANNLEELTPPLLRFQVLSRSTPTVEAGTLIDYRLRVHGVPIRWRTRIESVDPPHSFVDTQLRGPYALWHHTHTFTPLAGGTLARDRVRYRVRGGPLAGLMAGPLVRRDLATIFDYRRQQLARRFPSSQEAPRAPRYPVI